MSSTNKTTNYELTQFLPTDVPSWLVDYNGDMGKIDTQMKVNATAAATAKSSADGANSKADTNALNIASLDSALNTPNTGIVARVSDVEGDVDSLQELMGNGTPTTTDKTVIGAINELNTLLGSDSLNTEAQTVTGAINELAATTKKKYILIGDSYARGQNVGGEHGWIAIAKAALGLTEGIDVFSYAQNGYGFVGNNGTFASLLNQAVSAITNKDSITNIFVAGGYNDYSKNGISAAITSFVETARTAFPNAEITIAFNACCDTMQQANPINPQSMLITKLQYGSGSGAYKYIPNLYSVVLTKKSYMGSDGIHPTADGYTALGDATVKAILGSELMQTSELQTLSITTESGITEASGQQHYWRRNANEIRFWFISFFFNLSNVGGTSTTNDYLKLCTINDAIANSVGGPQVVNASAGFRITTANGEMNASGSISIEKDGSLRVRIPIFKSDNSRYLWSEVSKIECIDSFAFPIDQMMF